MNVNFLTVVKKIIKNSRRAYLFIKKRVHLIINVIFNTIFLCYFELYLVFSFNGRSIEKRSIKNRYNPCIWFRRSIQKLELFGKDRSIIMIDLKNEHFTTAESAFLFRDRDRDRPDPVTVSSLGVLRTVNDA